MADKLNNDSSEVNPGSVSRRNFLAATAGVAAISTVAMNTACARVADAEKSAAAARAKAPKAPFDTLRDYMAAIEAHGLVLRFEKVDQDEFEGAAIIYALIDKYGWYDAPAVIFENVKQDGKWYKGPVIVNHMGHWDTECIAFGIEPVKGNSKASYRKALEHTRAMLVDGNFPQIAPVEVPREKALCKQVIDTGDAVDLTKFAFIKSNPADGGRYVNTGSVFTTDPDMGVNFGT